MDRPARPTGVCVVDDQRAALLCRGLPPSEDAAAAATAVTAPPAPPAVVVALARSAVTTTSSAPATPRCPPPPASSPAWRAEKRRVVMPGLRGWVGRLPPSGWPPPAGWVVVGPSWWWCVCVVEVGECRSVGRARRGRKAKLDANAEARLPCECVRVGRWKGEFYCEVAAHVVWCRLIAGGVQWGLKKKKQSAARDGMRSLGGSEVQDSEGAEKKHAPLFVLWRFGRWGARRRDGQEKGGKEHAKRVLDNSQPRDQQRRGRRKKHAYTTKAKNQHIGSCLLWRSPGTGSFNASFIISKNCETLISAAVRRSRRGVSGRGCLAAQFRGVAWYVNA